MAMKKKIATGLGAVLITAMCLGGTAFAADVSTPVNGSGATSKDGTSDVGVIYTKAASGDATWTVNIPQKVDFGAVNDANPTVTKKLEYSAVISNTDVESMKEIESLTITLKQGQTFDLADTTHSCSATGAYSFKTSTNTDIVASGTIATLKTAEKAEINAVLDVSKLKTATSSAIAGDHNFTGSFGVTIKPNNKTT